MIYVVGFLFSTDRRWVSLIQKNRPEWQAGKYNGIGGKVEPGESIHDAMEREFYEETGVTVPWNEWNEFALLRGDETAVYVFRAFDTKHLSHVKTTTDEPVMNILVNHLLDVDEPYPIVPNLPVLLRLALMDNVRYTTLEY
jgi:8-oxo-dGTP diphosphatase